MSSDTGGSISYPKPMSFADKDPQISKEQQLLALSADGIVPAIAEFYPNEVAFVYQHEQRMLDVRARNWSVYLDSRSFREEASRLQENAVLTVAGERWPSLVSAAEQPEQIVKLIGAYSVWIDSSDKGLYKGLRGSSPTEFMQPIATWMRKHRQVFSSDHLVVEAFRTLLVQKDKEPISRNRLRLRQSILFIPENYSLKHLADENLETYRRDLVDFCKVLNIHPSPHLVAERNKLKSLTGKWVMEFDLDNEKIRKLQRRVNPEAQRIGERQTHKLDETVANLVLDTTALVAAKGSTNAEKIWNALDKRREGQTLNTHAKAVPVAEIINIANALTVSINAAEVLESEDGSPVKLDQLPRGSIHYLPEAFRRILYSCLDLDGSLSNIDDVVEELGIEERVEIVMDYIWKREGGPREKAVGSTALAGIRNIRGEELRRANGKPQHRANLYVPGYGQIS